MAVFDGDTFTMNVDGNTVTVRLAGVGAPERGQPGAEEARHELTRLLGQGNITYRKHSESYDRWVCDIWNAQKVHVNEAMRQFLGGYSGR